MPDPLLSLPARRPPSARELLTGTPDPSTLPVGPVQQPPEPPMSFGEQLAWSPVDIIRGLTTGFSGPEDSPFAKAAELAAAGLPLLNVKGLVPAAETAGRGLYSRIDDLLTKLPAKGAHPNKVASLVKGGASAEEAAYRKLPEFLASKGNQLVTPAELQAHLKQHPAPFPEVKTLGQPRRPEVQAQLDEITQQRDYGGQLSHWQWEQKRDEILKHAGESPPTKYSSFTLPGGEQYRESLLTLPPAMEKQGRYKVEIVGRGGQTVFHDANLSGTDVERLRQRWTPEAGYQVHFEEIATPTAGFQAGHFDQPNVLAHVRHKERTLPTGERGRFVEEVQSDWHQKGKQQGYARDPVESSRDLHNAEAEARTAEIEHHDLLQQIGGGDLTEPDLLFLSQVSEPGDTVDQLLNRLPERYAWHPTLPEEHIPEFAARARVFFDRQRAEGQKSPVSAAWNAMNRLRQTDERARAARGAADALRRQQRTAIPDAPFKETWPDLALKQQLLETAADPEATWLGFTTGQTQVGRYPHLSKFISEVHYSGTNLKAYGPEGNVVFNQTGIGPQELPDYIGREVADRLLAQPAQGSLRSLSGVDLEVGPAKGMYSFYDELLPKRLSKLLKPFGGTVERGRVSALPEGAIPQGNPALEEAEGWIARLTPEMKERIRKEGLPLMMLPLLLGAGLTGDEDESDQVGTPPPVGPPQTY